MSTLASVIIQESFREANYVSVGQVPTAAELTEALSVLNRYISSLFGHLLGELVTDWFVPNTGAENPDYRLPLTPDGSSFGGTLNWQSPPANVRLVVNTAEDRTVFFPANPSNGARIAYLNISSTGLLTLNGNGRLIDGALTQVESVAGDLAATWFYRADLGEWIPLADALLSTDEVPLPSSLDDLLITGLAIRMAARYSVKDLDRGIYERNATMMGRAVRLYKQTQPTASSDRELTLRYFDERQVFPA